MSIPREITVTFFSDRNARKKAEIALAPHELGRRIKAMVAAEKARLPWLKLARFGTNRTEKNSLRHDDNVLAITGVEGDYDGGEVTFDEAVEIAEKAGLACIVYTSPSHTEAKPRWRVLCPTSRELPPSDRTIMMARLNGLYGGIFADESWTLSQSYYYGRVVDNHDHRVEMIEGECIDLLDELDKIAIGRQNGSAGNGRASAGPIWPDTYANEAALSKALVSGENYHRSAVRLAGKWAMLGVPLLDAKQRLEALFDSVPEDKREQRWQQRRDEIPRTLDYVYPKEAAKEDEAPAAAPERPSPAYPAGVLSVNSLYGVARKLSAASEGERNALLFWSACRFGEAVAHGLIGEDGARRILTEVASGLGLTDHEIGKTINSGFGRVGR